VESDDALTFWRADGRLLVRDSGAVSDGAGKLKCGSARRWRETETRIPPHKGAATD
jgi:hypothetical protein